MLLERFIVGDEITVITPRGRLRATHLGVVGRDGWTLTDAVKLMCDIAAEREAVDDV